MIKFSRKQLRIPYLVFLLVFVVLPLFVILYYALTNGEGQFTWENFREFFVDGAIKFCNIAIMAIEKKDMEKAHVNLKKAQAIISELRVTLDHKYPVWEDFDRVYDYIYRRLVEGNMSKEIDIIEDALKYIREMRDTWKEVMKKAAGAK